MDNFGVEHVVAEHVEYLINTLQPHYGITEDWSGTKFMGIDLD